MKKQYKQIVSFIISIIIFMTSLIFPSFAQEDILPQDYMNRLAEQTISVVYDVIDGSTQTTYKNIDTFIENVQCLYPDTSDLEIAQFVMQYTNQSTDNLPDEIVLRALEAKEVTTRIDYIEVDASGNQTLISQQELQQALTEDIRQETISPQDIWVSSNGYMQIETTGTLRNRLMGKRYYTVSAKADWLKMPVCFFEDVLAIAHTGKFDDSVKEFGYKYQNNKCCGTVIKYNDSTDFPHGNLSLDYPSSTGAAIRFKLKSPYTTPQCGRNSITHLRFATYISAYLTYGIVVDGTDTLNVQGAYCHKKIALGSIGASYSNGSVSFSLSIVGTKDDYNARSITLYA